MAGPDPQPAWTPGSARRPDRHRGATWLGQHWRTVGHWVVVLAALGYLTWQAPKMIRSAGDVHVTLDHLQWWWVVLAALLGVGALAVYGELHRRLLLVGDAPVPAATVQGITFAENAVSNTVPVVGGAGAVAYAISRLRRRGVDSALASWTVLFAGVMSTLTLIVLGVVALTWAGRLPVGWAVLLIAVIVLGSVAAWAVVTHPAVLRHVMHVLLRIGKHVPWNCRHCRATWERDPDQVSDRIGARLGLLRPSPVQWLVLITFSALAWALDYLTLNASAASVGAFAPWTVLALGFLLVQGSIALQVLPGGAGLAETGLLGVLLAAGVAAAPAAATVLIYRAISWLGLSLVGWVVYAVQIHRTPARHHRHTFPLIHVAPLGRPARITPPDVGG
ncbi:lysylphosphatidylglycerol synthase transmembrane domain-containing protein [Pseudonocardia acidicola]|uniref:Flippase-like domain-containing protein n=1 Tax=Pseudonocardia acidicola TaxID=2724939 RepID=A0ABX1SD86_9PSEU|nr:lysylphosphatidylglycerol synthase transmembrane domain-containing protein [Pseudonocardia acidicola]NMH98311.1 flippase-like domain-containing protein [Pseudonocardia acidicola]